MGLSSPDSIAEHVKDYDCLIEGIEFFLKLEQEILKQRNIEAIRGHYEQHPEDKVCHIYRPGTSEMVLCRRSGIDAIQRIAIRLIEHPKTVDLHALPSAPETPVPSLYR